MDTVQPVEGHYLVAPLIPELLAWVEVDGEPVKVYGAEVTENKAVGYIEAKEGQQFKVCYLDNRTMHSRPKDDYAMQLRIDGTYTAGQFTRSDHSSFSKGAYSKARMKTLPGRQVSERAMQPFFFSKLLTTDSEDLACSDENLVKNLGALQLRYRRVTKIQTSSAVFHKPGKAILIHEQAKKAQLSHQANFGEAVPIEPLSRTTCDFFDSSESPFFSIEFRYRSRQLLQLDDCIPHSPAPSPEPSRSPSPSPPISPAPAQVGASDPRIAVTSISNPSDSSAQLSQSSQTQVPEHARLARLQAELESLRRQERMAALRRQIEGLEAELGVSGNAETSSSIRKIKAEATDDQREAKRVKREAEDASLTSSSSNAKGKGKGKEKKKPEVIELSDSD
ncbi:uncharacterized protein JCM6883_002787 [Sporobolomyces salmoneus]|uniref:uncharacterized protein n=1 Tax=Sporobolomyces salmoneus TaxID=183962 RepID=UPI0031827A19